MQPLGLAFKYKNSEMCRSRQMKNPLPQRAELTGTLMKIYCKDLLIETTQTEVFSDSIYKAKSLKAR